MALACLAISLGSNFAFAQEKREVKIDSINCVTLVSVNDKCDPLTITGTLYKSAIATDAAVIIMHGSQGVDDRHHRYASYLNSIGYSALVLDSWTARRVSMVHKDYAGNEKKGARTINQALDVLRAAAALRSMPEAYSRIGHLGESMGGIAATWLVRPYTYSEYERLFGKQASTLGANAALYAGCFERNAADRFLPIETFFLGGELDNVTPAKLCERFSDWMNSKGGMSTFKTLSGRYHDFDAPYRLVKITSADNPSDCAYYIDGNTRTWEVTGEQFPMTADGYRAFQSKCVRKGFAAPINVGYVESANTGFKEWGDFFLRTLGSP
jgi:dienelactone hydrolase